MSVGAEWAILMLKITQYRTQLLGDDKDFKSSKIIINQSFEKFPPKLRIILAFINPPDIFRTICRLIYKITPGIKKHHFCLHLGCIFSFLYNKLPEERHFSLSKHRYDKEIQNFQLTVSPQTVAGQFECAPFQGWPARLGSTTQMSSK